MSQSYRTEEKTLTKVQGKAREMDFHDHKKNLTYAESNNKHGQENEYSPP